MTQLLRTLIDERATLTGIEEALEATPASPDAIRLALRLRESPGPHGGRVLLFVPAASDGTSGRVVDDAVRGLLHLGERPILVMDLRAGARGAREDVLSLPLDRPDGTAPDWYLAPIGPASFIQPFAGRHDAVAYAASPEFAVTVTQARSRYAFVLAIGDPLARSVETLAAASTCDAVVLAVEPGRTTRRDLQQTSEQLRRARASVLGFVLDARAPEGTP